jgi:hypothetical protein
MASEVAEAVTNSHEVAVSDEVKPYKIHVSATVTRQFSKPNCAHARPSPWLTRRFSQVSSRYLDLTKQKLEITRLPHEVSEPKSEDWWEPKPQVEPLIDFW